MADTHLVKFVVGTEADFAALQTKDPDTLYFITDSHTLYKGNTRYSGGRVWSNLMEFTPATATAYGPGDIWVNTADHSVAYCTGSDWIYLVKTTSNLDENSAADEFATAKQIYNFVKESVANVDMGSIETALDEINTEIADLAEYKADKATTLEGYGIGDAYTMEQTDFAIAKAVANTNHLKYEIVETLPNPDDADENTIYMVLDPEYGENNNVYNEYMFVGEDFEKIGSTAGDFVGYATTGYVDNAIEAAKDYVDDLSGNYATYKQGALADNSVQGVVAGNDNGTIYINKYNTETNSSESKTVKIPGFDEVAEAANNAVQSVTAGLADGFILVDGADVQIPGFDAMHTQAESSYHGVSWTTDDGGKLTFSKGNDDYTPDVINLQLGSAAFAESSSFDASGAAASALDEAKEYTDAQILAALTWHELVV